MISLDKIREDLKDIRYYYARKKIFDSVSGDIGLSKVRDTVNLYNRTMPGILYEKEDYNFNIHRRQVTIQNTYFNERFGRCDIEPIRDRTEMGSAMAYIMKYIEKSGEKIVYSRGLPQYFKSDILDDDVVCPIGMEDQKLLLFDNFSCFEDGVYIGEVSPEVIKQMKKAN